MFTAHLPRPNSSPTLSVSCTFSKLNMWASNEHVYAKSKCFKLCCFYSVLILSQSNTILSLVFWSNPNYCMYIHLWQPYNVGHSSSNLLFSVIKHGLLENSPSVDIIMNRQFSSYKPPFSSGIFQLAMFDFQRVPIKLMWLKQ